MNKLMLSVCLFIFFGLAQSSAFSGVKFNVERDGYTWVTLTLQGGMACEGSEGFIESVHQGSQTGSYFNVEDALDSKILLQEFILLLVGGWAGNAGYSIVDITYANGSSFDRPMRLEIDYPRSGTTESFDLTLAPTGGWDTWSVESIEVPPVRTGTSTNGAVRLISLTEEGGPNLDTLKIFTSLHRSGSGGGGGGPVDCPSAPIAEEGEEEEEGVTASLKVNADWGAGYCAEIVLENTGSTVIDWDVSLEVEGQVNNLWNAIWDQSGSTLSLQGLSWNNTINPGQTQNGAGFCASR